MGIFPVKGAEVKIEIKKGRLLLALDRPLDGLH